LLAFPLSSTSSFLSLLLLLVLEPKASTQSPRQRSPVVARLVEDLAHIAVVLAILAVAVLLVRVPGNRVLGAVADSPRILVEVNLARTATGTPPAPWTSAG
jgi:type VI protein secretion system component VasK